MVAPKINPYSHVANMPAHRHAIVVPHNDNDLPELSRGIMITAAGNVAIHDSEGNSVIYPIVNVPFIIPILGKRVLATGTTVTAGNVIRMW